MDGIFNEQYTTLRNRIISITLRKTRTDQNRTLESVADNCMIPADDLEQLESGDLSIPWPVLECLCEGYELSVNTLIANIKPSEIESDGTTTLITQAPQIPEELHNFINNPANLPYLELAKKLSELDAVKLRNIAEGLLEITY